MGAIVNGLVLHGLRAFGSTFFNFLDYMKPAVRIASLMEVPTIQVYTHDSIGLGEDGPTHQPVEQLATLRAQPHIYCVRPADANETALAWRFALEQTETPSALVLTRQGLPIQNPDDIPDDAIHRGAYVLRDASNGERGPDPDRDRLGGAHLPRRGGPARGGRHLHARGLGPLSRRLRRAGRCVPRQRSPAGRACTSLG